MQNVDVKEMEKKTGTTTVGIVVKDGIVFASDRRATTMGYFIASKDIDKIYPIDEHIGITIAGSVGDAQKLVRWMQTEVKNYRLEHGKPISVEAAATLLANILSAYKFFPFWVQILIGGVDERPRLFSVDFLGGVTEEKMTSTGSGSPIAFGVLETQYKEDQSVEEGARLAAKSVWAAIRRDAGSGEDIDVVVITKKGFKRFDKKQVAKMVE
ncbi:MAG: archaeal proteasome endopeptidase complex subunit beta [Candidatus Anstonellales archaeon]